MKKILTATLIAVFCFQSSSFAKITVGQERRIGGSFFYYTGAWLGGDAQSSRGFTFVGWAQPRYEFPRPILPNPSIRFQAYLNGEPYGDPIIVYEDRFPVPNLKFLRGCADNNGNIYLLWSGGANSNSKRSSDYGQTWVELGLPAVPNSVEIEGAEENTKVVGCNDSGNVYVMWAVAADLQSPFIDIYYTHSVNFGENWSKPVRINSADARIKRSINTGRPVLAAGPKGSLYVAWVDVRDAIERVYLNYSTDKGASWQPQDIRIDQHDFFKEGTHIVLSADLKENVYVAWEEQSQGTRDSWILLRRSTDGGATWLNQQFIKSYDYYGKGWTRSRSGNSNLALDGQGSVYGIWRYNVRDQIGDFLGFNYSRNYGVTWNQETIIDNENSWDTGEMCVNANGTVFVVYGKQTAGYAGYHLFANASQDGGQTWECSAKPEECRLDNASPGEYANPRHFRLACGPSGAIVVWDDHREGLERGLFRSYFNTVEVA